MNEFGVGAGLAALGFWLFVAVVIIVGVWAAVRRREMHLAVVRQILESGQKLDQAVLDRLFPPRAAARNAGLVLAVLGIFIAALGLNDDIDLATAAIIGALSFLAGAYVWLKADL